MKTLMMAVMAGVMAGAVGGCGSSSIFDRWYEPYRADFGEQAIPVAPPPPSSPKPTLEIVNPDPVPGIAPVVVDQVTGTWTFVTPPTVTRVEHKTGEFSQFSLYMGRPAAGDTPFVVITVSAEPKGVAETDPATYQVKGTREYALNGNVCREWTGNTKEGRGFCELLVKKPGGTGDVCHALAVVKNAEEQKLALEILGSLKWAANPNAGTRQDSRGDEPGETYYVRAEIRDLTARCSLELGDDGVYQCVSYHRTGDGPWVRSGN